VAQFFEMLAYDFDLNCNRLSKTEVLLALNDMVLADCDRAHHRS
jgi:general secretion pathway protein A